MGRRGSGQRRENRKSNGLEVPCSYKLKGTKDVLLKEETIINEYFERTVKKWNSVFLLSIRSGGEYFKICAFSKPMGLIPVTSWRGGLASGVIGYMSRKNLGNKVWQTERKIRDRDQVAVFGGRKEKVVDVWKRSMQYQYRRSISVLEWCQCCKYCFWQLTYLYWWTVRFPLPITHKKWLYNGGGGGG